MNDVERLFRRLVEVLASEGSERLRESFDLASLYQTLIPYRTNRGTLRFDTNEDYEMALLRLLAGEHGYVELESADIAKALAEEVRSVNPNPGAFRSFGQARGRLSFKALKDLIDAAEPYAPTTDAVVLRRDRAAAPPISAVAPETCPQCSMRLPGGRAINFCPYCGGNVKVRDCPHCGTKLDIDWRHCVTCGHRVT